MDTNTMIGQRIKNLRTEKKYTLKYMSENTGLSIGFLSQLERGLTSVAVDSLGKIADVLDVELSSFFGAELHPNDSYILRRYEPKSTAVNPEIIQYTLTSDVAAATLLPRLVEVMPATQDESDQALYSHEGEEFLYILEGVLTLQIEEHISQLYPGDSAHFPSTLAHNWRNDTNHIVRFLMVHTPNPFRPRKS